MPESDQLTVLKLKPTGELIWSYSGRLLELAGSRLVLEAFFDLEDRLKEGMLFAKGDRFIETYYSDRWYNIFTIYSRGDDSLRGWYANIARPALFERNTVSYVDLALDLLVFPDGRQVVLDEDEFVELDLAAEEKAAARQALAELQSSFRDYLAGSEKKGLRSGNYSTGRSD
ncbi:MAG TPA: DUF402 domain-containing protein [Anaerolineales bacterium]|nr:DUF402 domain-containing protein [Anaerolineales bacterium]